MKWEYENLKETALMYNTISDFRSGANKAYQASSKRGILDEITSHMTRKRTIWSKEMLKEEALKYNSRIDFYRNNSSAYQIAIKSGILDDICSHMAILGNIYNRFIYIIKFENNSVYIGLTGDLERRKLEHIEKSSNKHVNRFIKEGVKYTFDSDNILYNIDDVGKMECSIIEEYKERGYNVLNISKGGGLGSKSTCSDDMIRKYALQFNSRSEFEKYSRGAYQKAMRRGILDEVCSHMIKHFITWNDVSIKEEAFKYNTKSDFMKSNVNAYNAAIRRGILDNVCSHMIILKVKWTEEMLKKEALKYNTRSSFQKGSYGAYQSARKRGILDEICKQMIKTNMENKRI